MSTTHSWFAAVAVKSRSTRSRRVSGPSPASVIREPSFSSAPAKSTRRHQSLPGAARDHDAFSAQLSVELLRAVDPEVLRIDTANLDHQLLVPNRPLRGRAGHEGVVGARRSSRSSFSSSASRCASRVVVPGRWPSSISACRTEVRNVSGWIPSCSPTRPNAPGLVGWIQPRGHSHPRGPSPELVGLLPRCCHGAHPPVGSQPPPDPGRFKVDTSSGSPAVLAQTLASQIAALS